MDIEAVLDDTLELLGERFRIRNIALERNVEAALPEVRGKASQLEQVFINLFQNSIDALSDERGDASITIGFGAGLDRSTAWIPFADTGRGIQPDRLNKVFEPFYTTKGEGTGLGLATVKRAVVTHRGEIEVTDSELGGAKFIVTLPRNPNLLGMLSD